MFVAVRKYRVRPGSTAEWAVARLHADAAFLADLEAGKAELASVRAKGLKPVRDCDAEASAIALDPPSAP
jgi:hypothetical protein